MLWSHYPKERAVRKRAAKVNILSKIPKLFCELFSRIFVKNNSPPKMMGSQQVVLVNNLKLNFC